MGQDMSDLNMRSELYIPGRETFYHPGNKPVIKIPLSREEKWDLFPKIVFLGVFLVGGAYLTISAFVLLARCYLETGFCP